MTDKIKNLINQGGVYIKEYILNESISLLTEQRKINVQLQLRNSLNKLRGKQISKQLIVEFYDSICKINFTETQKIIEFKQNIYDIIKYYNTKQ